MEQLTMSARRMIGLKRREGFSLAEVTIALGILAFGVLAVAGAQLSALTMSRESRLRTEALYLAQQQMEAFQAMPSSGLLDALADPNYPNDPANPIDPDPADNLTRQFTRSWTITQDVPEPGVFTILVQVGWNDRLGRPQNVLLEGVRAGS